MVKFLSGILLLVSMTLIRTEAKTENDHDTDSLSVRQIDVADIFNKLFKLHLREDGKEKIGKGPFISFAPVVGYSLVSGWTGAIVSTTSFYTDTSRSKLSNILFNANYSQYHQYWFNLNDNIFFNKKGYQLFGDNRYFKFPTKTYGLGSHTTFPDAMNIDFSYLRLYEILYREVRPNVFLGLGYSLDYHWNIITSGEPASTYGEFADLQKGDRSVSSGLTFNARYDSRTNALNAQGGTFINMQFRSNMKWLGSDGDWQTVLFEIRYYTKFPGTSRNILGFWTYHNITLSGDVPYLDLPSTGWDSYSNTGRGYVPGRYTDRDFDYFETEYRIVLTRNGILGCVVFANVQSVSPNLTFASMRAIPGFGTGLRIKLNKYSNTNLAIDYGFGIEGSRGFFFNLGEVF